MEPVDQSYSDDDENFDDGLHSCCKLVDGIDIQELISTQQATFEVNTNVEDALEEQQCNYYNSENFLHCVNMDCIAVSEDEEEAGDGIGGTPFGKIARSMTNIFEDGKVKKKIKREGTGEVVPKDALVWIHYNSYVEYGDEPFDSTYLRGKAKKVRLGQGNLILGLEIGITTMKISEIAQFLIHPDLGFGKFGVPPRIPPNAELLFHVELIRFMDNAAVTEIEELTDERQREIGFPKIYKASEALLLKGNDQFMKGNYSSAIYNYKKALRLLQPAEMQNEEQQEKQQKLLVRIFVNLAVCYNKQEFPKVVCRYCQDALRINPRNTKALYNYANAQMKLGSLKEAKALALRARKINPNNKEINTLLKNLNDKMKKYQDDSTLLAQKAFQMPEIEKNPTQVVGNSIDDDFKNTIQKNLKEFVEDEGQNTLTLPSLGMTKQEENFLKEEVKKLGLTCRIAEGNGQMYIKKP